MAKLTGNPGSGWGVIYDKNDFHIEKLRTFFLKYEKNIILIKNILI